VTQPVRNFLTGVARLIRKYIVHNGCAAAYGGDNDVPVDGLGDMGGLVAHRVADVMDNTRPLSCQSSPAVSRSTAWRFRWP
jgi:hypothetical protein